MRLSIRLTSLLLCVSAWSATGPAWALFEDDGARVAINNILKRLDNIENRLQLLEQTGQGQMAIAQSLSEKDREIARLRGDLEVAQNKLRKLQNDYETLYTSLDERLAKLEPQTVDLDGKSITVPPQEFEAYQGALDHFKAGNFPQAEEAFLGFLTEYKESGLRAQVGYFLGSCQFAQGNYKESLNTQRNMIKSHPDSPRVPDAMLSIASSQLALKAVNNAKQTLNEIISKYPDSPAASSARERLKALG
ncbi:MAG: tol-pal system protein YbgF [Limnobacter sp.]|nr:tol-pal system protein YbgF [Limnobacter sp.]